MMREGLGRSVERWEMWRGLRSARWAQGRVGRRTAEKSETQTRRMGVIATVDTRKSDCNSDDVYRAVVVDVPDVYSKLRTHLLY